MKKIVTHPLMIKVYKVYKSCKIEEHIEAADNFAELAKKKISREIKKVGDEISIIEDSNIVLYMDEIKKQAIKDKEKEKNYE